MGVSSSRDHVLSIAIKYQGPLVAEHMQAGCTLTYAAKRQAGAAEGCGDASWDDMMLV